MLGIRNQGAPKEVDIVVKIDLEFNKDRNTDTRVDCVDLLPLAFNNHSQLARWDETQIMPDELTRDKVNEAPNEAVLLLFAVTTLTKASLVAETSRPRQTPNTSSRLTWADSGGRRDGLQDENLLHDPPCPLA